MGHGASVALPPDAVAMLRAISATALGHTRHAALVAYVGVLKVHRHARRWYTVVDERVLSRVHRAVETHVLARIHRIADKVEVASKIWFVNSISTTSIADAFDIAMEDVRRVQIGKRQYEVYNCGPELLNVPSLNKVTQVLELQDTQITSFLLDKCKWTAWKPPASWRMKVDQVYDLTVHVAVRKHGFLTNEIRVIRMRVGKKWVGPHHHNSDLAHKVKSQWLHRVDYETQDNIETAESAFFQTIKLAWDKYLYELSRLPKEDLRSSEESGNGFPFDEQDQHTSLRIKYLLETSLETIMSEKGTFFRSAHQYELWRMAQEDNAKHRACVEDNFAGPLLEAEIEALSELYEGKAMELEDMGVGGCSEGTGESLVVKSIPSRPTDG